MTGRELTAHQDAARENVAARLPNQAAECRLVIERGDGSRLTVNLPIDGFSQTDWSRIEALCASFLRA